MSGAPNKPQPEAGPQRPLLDDEAFQLPSWGHPTVNVEVKELPADEAWDAWNAAVEDQHARGQAPADSGPDDFADTSRPDDGDGFPPTDVMPLD